MDQEMIKAMLDKCEAIFDKLKKNVGGSLTEEQLEYLNDVLQKKGIQTPKEVEEWSKSLHNFIDELTQERMSLSMEFYGTMARPILASLKDASKETMFIERNKMGLKEGGRPMQFINL